MRRKTTGTLAAAGVADVRVALRATLDGPNASKRMRSSDTFSARNPSYKSRMYADGRVVAAVCHGPGGLIRAKKPDGTPLVAGLRVAGFTNEEEAAVGLQDVVPFALETTLRELGGKHEKGASWAPFAVRDGLLVTGQNPASSRRTALEVENARDRDLGAWHVACSAARR